MSDAVTPAVPFRSALQAWIKVAAYSFGGPAGQIAVLHRVVVDERKWLTEDRFIHALSYCMLLPGPEAQQLATYVGWLLHGVRGGLAAGLLFILPGFVSILLLSIAYVAYREMGVVAAVFFGLKPAVAAIVAEAVVRLKRRALKGSLATWIAAAAFIAIFVFDVPFPLIVIGAAIAGLGGDRFAPPAGDGEPVPRQTLPRLGPLIRTVLTWLVIWLAPVAALLLLLGGKHVFVREAGFFSKVALVTFGGAYAVLAYVTQQAVDVYGWLTAGQMLDGLGLAETTPGPLIMVVQFVGFLGAYGSAGTMDPILAGVVGSVVTTWVTFAPCFLFIFAGAPYVEWLRGHRALTAALGGVMAAVVGVVLNLAVWFALHVVFAEVASTRLGPARLWIPDLASVDPAAALIAVGALVAVLRYRVGMFPVLGAGAALGVLFKLVLGM